MPRTPVVGKQKTLMISYTKLISETLANINIFPFINLVVIFTVVYFFIANDLIILQVASTKSIVIFIITLLFASCSLVSIFLNDTFFSLFFYFSLFFF